MVDDKTALRPAYGAQAVLSLNQRQPLGTRQLMVRAQILTP